MTRPDSAASSSHLSDAEHRRPLRVLFVEEHEVVRRGLHEMLVTISRTEDGIIDDIRGVPSADAAVAAASEYDPDVLMIPSNIGSASAAALTSALPSAKILVLIRSAEPGQLAAAARLQGNGFVMEPDLTIATLGRAIAQLDRGEVSMPPVLARRMLQDASMEYTRADRFPLLTPRESEVLGLLVDGLTNKQIARALRISEHGAKRHVANVLMKLNCPNRTLAAARAISDGLVPPTASALVG